MTLKLGHVLYGMYCLVAIVLLASPFFVSAASSTTTSTTSNVVQGGIAGGDPVCASGSICTFTLTVENTGSGGLAASCPGAEAKVVINNQGTDTVITVSTLQGSSDCTPAAIAEFGYNDASSGFTSASCGTHDVTSGWSSVGPKTMSQFGTFNNVFADSSSTCTSVSFTLDSLVASYGTSTGSNPGYVFAVHAKFVGSTGFIATPIFPIGTILGVLAPLAALGLYLKYKGVFKLSQN